MDSTISYDDSKNESFLTHTTILSGDNRTVISLLVCLLLISVYLVLVTAIHNATMSNDLHKDTSRLCLAIAVPILARSLWFWGDVYVIEPSPGWCIGFSAVNVILASLDTILINIVLWLRQRSFYNSPQLAHLSSARLKTFSRVVWVGIVVCPIIQAGFLIALPISSDGQKCFSDEPSHVLNVMVAIVHSVALFWQIVLLFLVLYPLIKHRKKHNNRANDINRIVLRLNACTWVCVSTDVIIIALARAAIFESSFSYVAICYCFNTVINLVCLLLSFANWRLRLWPVRKTVENITPVTVSSY